MTPRILPEAVFNTLHDGTITAIAGTLPGDLVLTIECQYLRERIPTPGDVFLVTLKNCERFLYKKYGEQSVELKDLREIVRLEPEILSADERDGQVIVYSAVGELQIKFEEASIRLDEKTGITQAELETVAQKYWDEWKKRPPQKI